MQINSRAVFVAALLVVAPLAQADQAVTVATGKPGQTAFEFVGTITQNGLDMTMTGYLTSIAGLAESQLFLDPAVRSQSTARFAFTATGKVTARNVLAPLFVLNTDTITSITFKPTSAYSSPLPIATADSTLKSVVTVISPFTAQSPGKGLLSASGEFQRTTAEAFAVDGVTYLFGRANQLMRTSMVGSGTLTDPTAPVSTIVVAGSVVVVDSRPRD